MEFVVPRISLDYIDLYQKKGDICFMNLNITDWEFIFLPTDSDSSMLTKRRLFTKQE
ncbi:hypothetical protein LEP1GSC127_4618 [Leptospira kirschneri str. 200801925]|nr:hypothetical protein LEP1GSC127_4618 [Leptospira kirschneri str. 200801925]